jgi:hypothetical protein
MTPLQKGLFAWLPPVFRISEEQVFKMVGLDAAVFLRLHHLGIRFFGILTYVRVTTSQIVSVVCKAC